METNNFRLIWDVAVWEFRRWFKLKEHLLTVIIGALLSLLIFGSTALLSSASGNDAALYLINTTGSPVGADIPGISFTDAVPGELAALKEKLKNEETDGILIINDFASARIIVNGHPGWLPELTAALNNFRRHQIIQSSGIPAERIHEIFTDMEINIGSPGGDIKKVTAGEKTAAGITIFIMLAGVFFGLAYQFVAITGEKQLRITEVIVASVSPQTWIDGKIIGISLLSLVMICTYSLTSVVFVIISSLFGSGWALPLTVRDPLLVTLLLSFAFLGFFFWNTFFSAVAATINDPNTSARGSLLLVPLMPIIAAFFIIGSPGSAAAVIMSIFPLTAPPVMAARLVLTQVTWIEIVSSLLLLIISILLIRRAAGKIFALSILMYGKEPSLKEIAKWFKKT